MKTKLRWGIIGAGHIAGSFAKGMADSLTSELVAVASRSLENAQKFGAEHSIERCYGDYTELLADSGVDAVYIANLHPQHAEWAIKAAQAGKHILCEKPITMNYAQAQAVVNAARENDVFLMEAFMYRCHPQTDKLIEVIQSGIIGQVRLIRATFSFNVGDKPETRTWAHELGGGGILDVGGYCASMARLVAGVAQGKAFVDPDEVTAVGVIGKTRVDDYTVAAMKFPGDILAELSCGVQLNQDNTVHIFGSAGNILIPMPWQPSRNNTGEQIIINRAGAETQVLEIPLERHLYSYEIDVIANNLAARQAPEMSWDDTLGNMKTLDRWRAAIGLVYDFE